MLECNDDIDAMADLLRPMVTNSVAQFEKQDTKTEKQAFRIHWDGDFFSENYAKAWAKVIDENPAVTFWVYTRSFVEPVDVVPSLVDLPNLRLYLSADEFNNHVAQDLQKEYGKEKVHIAYCAKSVEDARRLEGENRLARICPENIGRISLVGAEQENGKMEGACITCGICFRGTHQDIIFTTDHEFSRVQSLPFDTPVHLQKTRKKAGTAVS